MFFCEHQSTSSSYLTNLAKVKFPFYFPCLSPLSENCRKVAQGSHPQIWWRHCRCPVLVCFLWQRHWLKATSFREGHQGRTSAAAAGEHCLLSRRCSGTFLIALRTTCPEVALPTLDWALPYQPVIKKMPSQTCLQDNLTETFLFSWTHLFPESSSLQQVDKKVNKIMIIIIGFVLYWAQFSRLCLVKSLITHNTLWDSTQL